MSPSPDEKPGTSPTKSTSKSPGKSPSKSLSDASLVPPGWPPESPATASLVATEGLVDAQLSTCRALAHAIGNVISTLSDAGQGLQRGTTSLTVDGTVLETRLSQEDDPPVSRAGRGLLAACSGLGVTLIGLAATLSGEVLSPLKEMHQCIESERAQKKQDLARLREHEMICSNALTESLQKKDKVLAELQGALKEQKESPKKQKARMLPLRSKVDTSAVAAAELKVQKAACSQTVAIEELAERTDEAMLARMRAEEGAQALRHMLANANLSRRRCLVKSIERCGVAWVDAAHSIQLASEQLRHDALELQRTTPTDSEVSGATRTTPSGGSKKLSWSDAGSTGRSPPGRFDSMLKSFDESDSDGQSAGNFAQGRQISDEDLDSPFVAPVPGRSSIACAGALCIPLSPSCSHHDISASSTGHSFFPSGRPTAPPSDSRDGPNFSTTSRSLAADDAQAALHEHRSPKKRPPVLRQLDASDDDSGKG